MKRIWRRAKPNATEAATARRGWEGSLWVASARIDNGTPKPDIRFGWRTATGTVPSMKILTGRQLRSRSRHEWHAA